MTVPVAGEEAGLDDVVHRSTPEAQQSAFSAGLTDLVGRSAEASAANAERSDGAEEPVSSVLVYLVMALDVMAPA